jgi:hypothetical protein
MLTTFIWRAGCIVLAIATMTRAFHTRGNCAWCHHGNLSLSAETKAELSISRYPMVDVFLSMTGSFEFKYRYIYRGDWWVTILLLYTLSNNDTRIHLLTDDDNAVRKVLELGPPINAIKMNDYESFVSDFMKIYKHLSVNDKDYEALCFYRWILYDRIVEDWNQQRPDAPIERIISLDLDILMFRNAAKLFHGITTLLKPPQESLFIILEKGAVHLFSREGLHRYSRFVNDWFNVSEEDYRHNAVSIGNAAPIGEKLHFSDMQMSEVYYNLNQLNSSVYTIMAHRDPNIVKCLNDALNCVPVSVHRDLERLKLVNDSIYAPHGFPLCFGVSFPYVFLVPFYPLSTISVIIAFWRTWHEE